jgi:hypothetical protein
MAVVKRIFRMVGTEGAAIRAVKRTFEREGLRTPEGKEIWGQFFIREAIMDYAYRPHSRREIEELVAKGQMSVEVASKLDPEKSYGIWWFNRRRTKVYQEAVNWPEGKRYKKRVKIIQRGRKRSGSPCLCPTRVFRENVLTWRETPSRIT